MGYSYTVGGGVPANQKLREKGGWGQFAHFSHLMKARIKKRTF